MARSPRVPEALTSGAFTLEEARLQGLDRWHLSGSSWRKVGRATFALASIEDGPRLRLAAARLRLPPGAVFSGLTAAWLHGLDVEPCNPIEVIAPSAVGISGRSGMFIRRCAVGQAEVVKVRGLPATSILRTLRDASLHASLTEAVVLADMALHRRLVRRSALAAWVDQSAGVQGIRTLRKVLEFVEPATESPMESRTRMLFVLGGLPRPEVQVPIRDSSNRFVARVDLYYREQRLAIEYDGGIHREKLAEDNRRQNRLLEAGIRLLRFTASDIYNTPDVVLSQVRKAITAPG